MIYPLWLSPSISLSAARYPLRLPVGFHQPFFCNEDSL
jgi:hypothetical protein